MPLQPPRSCSTAAVKQLVPNTRSKKPSCCVSCTSDSSAPEVGVHGLRAEGSERGSVHAQRVLLCSTGAAGTGQRALGHLQNAEHAHVLVQNRVRRTLSLPQHAFRGVLSTRAPEPRPASDPEQQEPEQRHDGARNSA